MHTRTPTADTLTRDPWGSDAPRREDEAEWNTPDTDDHSDTVRDVSGYGPEYLADIPDEWPDESEAWD